MEDAATTAVLLGAIMALIRLVEKLIDKRAKKNGNGGVSNSAILKAIGEAALTRTAEHTRLMDLLDRLIDKIADIRVAVAEDKAARRGTG